MAKIVIITSGTFGDFQPYASLALELTKRNAEVSLTGPSDFEGLAKRLSIDYHPLSFNFSEVLRTKESSNWLKKGRFLPVMSSFAKMESKYKEDIQRELSRATEGADLLVLHPLLAHWVVPLAEKSNIEMILACIMPLAPSTGAFPSIFLTTASLPKWINRLTHAIFFKAHWLFTRKQTNSWRQKLGLPKQKQNLLRYIEERKIPFLHGYSPNLIKRPEDWDDTNLMHGYWAFPKKTQTELWGNPSPELAAWLEAGPPPIFWGFGSMPVFKEQFLDLIRRINQTLGCRSIVGLGWSEISDVVVEKDLYVVDNVNHGWLFPQCAAIIHHGGVGTLSTALEAGTPSLVCSIIADQQFWGERVKALGLGEHIAFSKMGYPLLVSKLRKVLQPECKQKCEQFSEKIKAEDAVKKSADFVLQHLAHSQTKA